MSVKGIGECEGGVVSMKGEWWCVKEIGECEGDW